MGQRLWDKELFKHALIYSRKGIDDVAKLIDKLEHVKDT